ncbi:GDSL esterase/lipase 5 [Spatholobus suberectus]|nr:GDSL esterase/lipase 5 [Spatholobus suberectus]
MASLSVFVMLVVFLSSFILNIDQSHSQSSVCLPENHRALFIFGDSIYDPGNNDYINATTFFQANFPPYGETFFKYPSGRFSDGRVIPDFIAEYAELPLIPPYLHPGYHDQYIYGVNFASAGAGALAETNRGLPLPDGRFTKFRMANLRIQLWFLVSYANLYIATLCHGFCLPEEHIALFIFGDSMLDVGNNNYINTTTDMQANFWPNGETSFKYPSGRPSNGRLISDFIGAGALVETNQGLETTYISKAVAADHCKRFTGLMGKHTSNIPLEDSEMAV